MMTGSDDGQTPEEHFHDDDSSSADSDATHWTDTTVTATTTATTTALRNDVFDRFAAAMDSPDDSPKSSGVADTAATPLASRNSANDGDFAGSFSNSGNSVGVSSDDNGKLDQSTSAAVSTAWTHQDLFEHTQNSNENWVKASDEVSANWVPKGNPVDSQTPSGTSSQGDTTDGSAQKKDDAVAKMRALFTPHRGAYIQTLQDAVRRVGHKQSKLVSIRLHKAAS